MKQLIERVFLKTVNEAIKGENHEAIRKYIIEHPARYRMFDNLEKEIKGAGVVLDEMTGDMDKKRKAIEELVQGLTIVFAKTALSVKEKEISNRKESVIDDES